MKKRLLILCNYPYGYAPGQRFRFEQYIQILNDAGIETTVAPFFAPWVWPILFKPGNTFAKIWAVLGGFWRRFKIVRHARRFDYVFVHLEAAPVGPPIIEWLLFTANSKVVYDIDDAIFMSRTSAVNRLAAPLRWRSKVPYITRKAWKVTACNKFLIDWASAFNKNCVLLPTTIDPTQYKRIGRSAGQRPVIGWTGSRSNLTYLDIVMPALIELDKTHDFEFRVICDLPPDVAPALKHYTFVPWCLDTEVVDLAMFDIGVMPVPDNLWAKGKVGLKAIQYAGIAIVSVSSDVGSGPEVVIDGKTGFLVKNDEQEWRRALGWLLDHPESWSSYGQAARDYILPRYSVPSQAQTYIDLFS